MELTLAPLSNEPVTIRDQSGKVWTATVALSTADALLYRRMKGMDEEEVLGRLAALLQRSLLPHHPKLTVAEVEAAFGPMDLAQIYNAFLVQSGLRLSSATAPTKPTRKSRSTAKTS